MPVNQPEIIIASLGGNCPVQAEGTIDGVPFYFRARGDHWALNVGGAERVLHPDWRYDETYGVWPEAGWMDEAEALAFIGKAALLYVNRGEPTQPATATGPAERVTLDDLVVQRLPEQGGPR